MQRSQHYNNAGRQAPQPKPPPAGLTGSRPTGQRLRDKAGRHINASLPSGHTGGVSSCHLQSAGVRIPGSLCHAAQRKTCTLCTRSPGCETKNAGRSDFEGWARSTLALLLCGRVRNYDGRWNSLKRSPGQLKGSARSRRPRQSMRCDPRWRWGRRFNNTLAAAVVALMQQHSVTGMLPPPRDPPPPQTLAAAGQPPVTQPHR